LFGHQKKKKKKKKIIEKSVALWDWWFWS